VPDITLVDAQGANLKLSSLRGYVVLINFWATWCTTCKAEKPHLQRLYNVMRSNPRFKLLTVLYNDTMQKALAFNKELGYDMPTYADPGGQAAKALGLKGVPESYIIDKKGVLRHHIIGPLSWADEKYVRTLTEMTQE